MEIGCWEGKSTIEIANAFYPEIIQAVDSWKGNVDENPDHVTVRMLKEHDILGRFKHNIETGTKRNVWINEMDCYLFLDKFQEPIKFCHIDASHDYDSVSKTIKILLPKIVEGAVLCGDDIETANERRYDLGGGVERAVKELLPGYVQRGNFWHWVNKSV